LHSIALGIDAAIDQQPTIIGAQRIKVDMVKAKRQGKPEPHKVVKKVMNIAGGRRGEFEWTHQGPH